MLPKYLILLGLVFAWLEVHDLRIGDVDSRRLETSIGETIDPCVCRGPTIGGAILLLAASIDPIALARLLANGSAQILWKRHPAN